MNDRKIIDEAVGILNDGYSVTLPVAGRSMLPFIIGDKESVVLAKPSRLESRLVVLAWVENRRYVLHRIEKMEGDRLTLMGDGNLKGREYCNVADVKAVATHVVDKKGRKHPLYCAWRRRAVAAWLMAMPVRRYLLAVYRMIMG